MDGFGEVSTHLRFEMIGHKRGNLRWNRQPPTLRFLLVHEFVDALGHMLARAAGILGVEGVLLEIPPVWALPCPEARKRPA